MFIGINHYWLNTATSGSTFLCIWKKRLNFMINFGHFSLCVKSNSVSFVLGFSNYFCELLRYSKYKFTRANKRKTIEQR